MKLCLENDVLCIAIVVPVFASLGPILSMFLASGAQPGPISLIWLLWLLAPALATFTIFTHIRHATNIFIVSLTFYIITHICLGLRKNTKLYLHWFILQNLPIIYGLLSVYIWQKGFVSSQLITSSHINKYWWNYLENSVSERKKYTQNKHKVWLGFSHSSHIWL